MRSVYIAILSFAFVLFGWSSQLYDAFCLNVGNLSVVRHPSTSLASIAPQDWPRSEWVQERLRENAETATIIAQLRRGAPQQQLADEFYTALTALLPRVASFPELCDAVRQNEDILEVYALPAFSRLTQHPEGSDWKLKAISLDNNFESSSGNAALVLWWQKRVPGSKVAIPLAGRALSVPCLAGEVIGMPIAVSILNRDPRFIQSAQVQDSHLANRYADYYGAPFLVDFRPLDLVRDPPTANPCLPQYTLRDDLSDSPVLELLPPCTLVGPTQEVHRDDLLLLVVRFKTTERGRGEIPFWWGNINIGSYTGGYSGGVWRTHVLLFDMPRCCTNNGRIMVLKF